MLAGDVENLLQAIHQDEKAVSNVINELKSKGKDLKSIINSFDKDGKTLLYFAIFVGNPNIVEILLKNGADPNLKTQNDIYPLWYATELQNLQIIELLLKHGADSNIKNQIGETLLYTKVFFGKLDIIDLLLKYKADINLPNKSGVTPLYIAISLRNLELIEKLIKLGANVNAPGIWENIFQIFQHLDVRDKIANLIITAKDFNVNLRNKKGETPLILATKSYQTKEIIKLLLEKGADFRLRDNAGKSAYNYAKTDNKDALKQFYDLYAYSSTKLIEAVQEGDIKDFNKLMNNPNVDINFSDDYGFTASMRAAQGSMEKDQRNRKNAILKILLDKGADITFVDPIMKKTALGWAEENNNVDAIALITEYEQKKKKQS